MQYSYGLYERNLQVSTKQGISWKKKSTQMQHYGFSYLVR